MGNTYPENTVSGEALIDEIFNSQMNKNYGVSDE